MSVEKDFAVVPPLHSRGGEEWNETGLKLHFGDRSHSTPLSFPLVRGKKAAINFCFYWILLS